ncbi:MAG: hypothetical protein V4498_08070 [candidate division FCPU426 bacterium]
MARHATMRAGLALILIAGLSACAGGRRQNPVASNEEIGQVTQDVPVMVPPDEKSQFYVSQDGDTLKGIAGRPEIFGDPNLWPLILDANADVIGPDRKVPVGVQLRIPRDTGGEQIAAARERARQDAIYEKKGYKPRSKRLAPMRSETRVRHSEKLLPTLEPTPEPVALESEPKEAPKKSKAFGKFFAILIVVLAALFFILFWFRKKDEKEGRTQP